MQTGKGLQGACAGRFHSARYQAKRTGAKHLLITAIMEEPASRLTVDNTALLQHHTGLIRSTAKRSPCFLLSLIAERPKGQYRPFIRSRQRAKTQGEALHLSPGGATPGFLAWRRMPEGNSEHSERRAKPLEARHRVAGGLFSFSPVRPWRNPSTKPGRTRHDAGPGSWPLAGTMEPQRPCECTAV